MMTWEMPEKLAKLVRKATDKAIQDAYSVGYTKGVEDGPKVKEIADDMMCVAKPVVPKPCVRGIDMRTMKALLLKLDEEIDEFKFEIMQEMGGLDDGPDDVRQMVEGLEEHVAFRIAEEGADVATIVATICNAIGVDEKTRFEAQAYVNKHNHERGRL